MTTFISLAISSKIESDIPISVYVLALIHLQFSAEATSPHFPSFFWLFLGFFLRVYICGKLMGPYIPPWSSHTVPNDFGEISQEE